MPQGTIKHYDTNTREGSLFTDEQTEVHIDATSVEGANIRLLRIGQRVRFDLAEEGGRKLARGLRLVTFD